jgi:hypothetical protein
VNGEEARNKEVARLVYRENHLIDHELQRMDMALTIMIWLTHKLDEF